MHQDSCAKRVESLGITTLLIRQDCSTWHETKVDAVLIEVQWCTVGVPATKEVAPRLSLFKRASSANIDLPHCRHRYQRLSYVAEQRRRRPRGRVLYLP